MSSEATTRTARAVSAGPRTARLVAPMSRPIRAETPAPPAAAAPTCQAMTCWARRSPMRPGVRVIRAGKTPARAPPRTAKAITVPAGPGCHQMTAAAITASAVPKRTTVRGGTGRGTRAREIRTAVSAPQ
jgi:hypothetical protein